MASPRSPDLRDQAEAFARHHLTGLVTLLFTDMVDSTALKQQLGRQSFDFFEQHHRLIRETLARYLNAREIETAGDSFFLIFAVPSDAVEFALVLQSKLRALFQGAGAAVQDRIGIHLGEVVIREADAEHSQRGLFGLQVDTCSRVMGMAAGGQILMTRSVFDSARQVLKAEAIAGLEPLSWVSHGFYLLKGVEDPIEVCEVAEIRRGLLKAPTSSEKARRYESPVEEEPVLGWRPAVGQAIPGTPWVMEQPLGHGGFGEVWLGRHKGLKERRVFKFCFRADRVRSLKREVTLFKVLKERIGGHPNIVGIQDVFFDEPPYYVMMDYAAGQDLAAWCEARGGIDNVPLETRLEIVAQVAEALQAAHDAGIIHRDVKPANILVEGGGAQEGRPVRVRLTDFGIGQVLSAEYLAGVTRAGFTRTMLADSDSSSRSGTQLYMAPELLAGQPASIRSDIYSLGVVLYQIVHCKFGAAITIDWLKWIKDPLLREDLERCLAGIPEDRFAGAAELARRLRSYESRQTERLSKKQLDRKLARRRQIAVVASGMTALSMLVAGALAYGLWQAHLAQQDAEANAYAADINLAQQALAANDLGQASTLLERYRNGSGREYLRGFEWRYLATQCRSDALAIDAIGSGSVFRLAFSPDGQRLAVGGPNWCVELRDPKTLRRVITLQTNDPSPGVEFLSAVVAFAPTGDLMAASAGPHKIRLWQTATRQPLGELLHPRTTTATCLSFSPDARHLAVFHWLGGACIWDLETRQVIRNYPEFRSEGEQSGDVAFSPDGQLVAIGDTSGHIRLINWMADSVVIDIPAHQLPVTALAFSPDGEFLASGSGFSSGAIRLWDPATGESRGELEGHGRWISTLQFSADSRRLFSSSADQTIRIWKVATRQCLVVLKGHLDEVWSMCLSPDDTMLVSGSREGKLCRWPTDLDRAQHNPLESPSRIAMPLFVDRGTMVSGLGNRGKVVLWNVQNPNSESTIDPLGLENCALASVPSHGLLACGNRQGEVKVFDLERHALVKNLTGLSGRVACLSFFKNGNGLLAVDQTDQAVVWETSTWTKTSSFQTAHEVSRSAHGLIHGAALSPDGRWLVLGLLDGRLSWWDPVSGTQVDSITGHRKRILGLAFSPDGDFLASSSGDGTSWLWSVRTRRKCTQWRFDRLADQGVAFTPDGARLINGQAGGAAALKLWDLKTSRCLLKLPAEGNLFLYVSLSEDGNSLLAGSRDFRCYVWRAVSFAELEETAPSPSQATNPGK